MNKIKLDKWNYEDVMREAGRGFFGPLMDKGREIGLRDYVPTHESWFITRQNSEGQFKIVKKVSDEEIIKMRFYHFWFIYLKTLWLELKGF